MRICLVLASLAVLAAAQSHAAGLVLTTDPFRKPELEALPEVEALPEIADVEPEPVEMPELRGILRSPRATLVNLNGELVAVGERFAHFMVVAVGERNVVLLDGDEQIVVTIDNAPPPARGKRNAQSYR